MKKFVCSPPKRHRAFLMFLGSCFLLSVLAFSGCDRSGERLAKEKKTTPLIKKKVVGVQGHLLAGSTQAMLKSSQLSLAQAAGIIGAFRYKAKATYLFEKPGADTKKVNLVETILLDQNAKGDFRLLVENNKDKGYEAIWLDEKLYFRMRHRPFRLTSLDTTRALRWQMRSFGRWRSIVEIFGKQLALVQEGADSYLGRNYYRYQVSLLRGAQKPLPIKEGTAWAGPLPNHTRGAAEKFKRIPTKASGTLWIDKAKGLPLKVIFRGGYNIMQKGKVLATASIQLEGSFQAAKTDTIVKPKKIRTIKQENDPLDPFARKRPEFLKSVDYGEELDKKRKKRKKRRRR